MNIPRCLLVGAVAVALCVPQARAALSCSITSQGNQVVISWPSESGRTYALHRNDKPDGSWRVVSLKTAAEEPLSVTVPLEGTTAFFRLIEAPPNPDPDHLVWIPPGTFTMGSPTNEVDRNMDEGPQTVVTLTMGFWMGKYEVTQGEYQAVIGNNPSWFNGVQYEGTEWEIDWRTDVSRPVEQVSWDDSAAYCAALTERERAAERIPTNYVYRLPTEAEWECACRAGTMTRFSYGDDPGYANLTDYAWYIDNSDGQTHPVGQKLPNPWGLYDLHGNVYERCQDWWAPQLPGGTVLDPQGPDTGSDRVIRGGVWHCWAGPCRSAVRLGTGASARLDDIGFRVVLAVIDTGEPPNPDPTKLVWIPPGTFTMGSPEDEVDRSNDEGPQTLVTLTKGFWMEKGEVTQAEYLAVMGNNPSWCNGDHTAEGYRDYGVDLNRPVEQVTWIDATNYCGQLTARERAAGRIPGNWLYRLPTDAEWEYACRAGTTTRFNYGNDPDYTDLTNYAWYRDNSDEQAHPVRQKLPNSWGIHDMHGNVWEWCQDWATDHLPGGFVLDPQGPATGSYRVPRGGSWYGSYGQAMWCRSASRIGCVGPDSRDIDRGFRVVLAQSQP